MDISEQLGSTTTQEEVEPFLEVTPELVQKRRSKGGIIWDRFIRNRAAVVGVAALLFLVLFVLSAAFTDGCPRSVIILIAILSWTYAGRLVRGEFLALREREFVMASRTIGARDFRLMFRHILPNAAGPIIVNATLLVGGNIILESVLSYFGFGVKPPNASWGNMIAEGQDFFNTDPWLVYAPGLLIFFTVLSLNLV